MKYNFIVTIALKILSLIILYYQFKIYNEKIIMLFIMCTFYILVAFCFFNIDDLKSELGDSGK